MASRSKKKNRGYIVLFVIFAVMLGILLFANKTWFRLLSLYRDASTLREEIASVKKENKELEQEIKRLETDYEYVEKIAREELGMVMPGEIEYRFVPLGRDKEKK
ncbi:MAG: septum formation initiator family protein [bacterium]